MNTARYNSSALAPQASHATVEPTIAPSRGTATAAAAQHAAIPTAPTTMPTASRRAFEALSNTSVITRLATATDGAAENSPENALGEVASPMTANTTTSVPPASPRSAITPTSLTPPSHPGTSHLVLFPGAVFQEPGKPPPHRARAVAPAERLEAVRGSTARAL